MDEIYGIALNAHSQVRTFSPGYEEHMQASFFFCCLQVAWKWTRVEWVPGLPDLEAELGISKLDLTSIPLRRLLRHGWLRYGF